MASAPWRSTEPIPERILQGSANQARFLVTRLLQNWRLGEIMLQRARGRESKRFSTHRAAPSKTQTDPSLNLPRSSWEVIRGYQQLLLGLSPCCSLLFAQVVSAAAPICSPCEAPSQAASCFRPCLLPFQIISLSTQSIYFQPTQQ